MNNSGKKRHGLFRQQRFADRKDVLFSFHCLLLRCLRELQRRIDVGMERSSLFLDGINVGFESSYLAFECIDKGFFGAVGRLRVDLGSCRIVYLVLECIDDGFFDVFGRLRVGLGRRRIVCCCSLRGHVWLGLYIWDANDTESERENK